MSFFDLDPADNVGLQREWMDVSVVCGCLVLAGRTHLAVYFQPLDTGHGEEG